MTRLPITTVLLAGGQGRRIGGDKGLQLLHGRPLLAWVLDSVQHQSDEVLVSANDGRGKYAGLGYPVIADQLSGWAGPLAGLQAGMRSARNDWVACVPCDTPFLPGDWLRQLYAAAGGADAVVAVVEGRRQPAIALYRKSLLSRLDAYLAAGERRVGGWLDTLAVSEVEFDNVAAFVNINSVEELAAANRLTGRINHD